MTKLGIIGAMDVEVQTLVDALEQKCESRKAGSTFYEGLLCGLPVVIVECGVGKVNAALCAQILCDCFQVTSLVNTGIAGSLRPELDIGDLMVSLDAVYHDVDCRFVNYPLGMIPGMPQYFSADEKMIAYAFSAAETVNSGHTHVGRIATGDQFIADSAEKEKIVAATQAACVEMEGGGIAHTAFRNGIPFVILRAISDKADHSAEMDYPAFEAIAASRCAKVTMAMAREIYEDEQNL